MLVFETVPALKAQISSWRQAGRSIALVPTMGFFHQGHATLMRKAAGLADKVVVSIFVNPTQFGPQEDLGAYPRDPERDRAIARANRVDAVFMPGAELMYPPGFDTWVESPSLSRRLCGLVRPAHFRGVCTVVLKLFNLVQPDVAVFGEKDWQQLAVIRRMAGDLDVNVRIEGAPLVREADGLALSSRNSYLTPEERAQAPELYMGLKKACRLYREGERETAALGKAVRDYWAVNFPLGKVDYLHILDGPSLEEVRIADSRSRAVTAVYLGKARLIDNVLLSEND
ncbi:MAG: pantoate--beta-alanine ligase [Deltaproteobacteria bacterium]|jgi:pantoate--beta-alanine ligase|nr:pantoate--beta-alanine ligase [Deltaproteobacteria bacterium]